MPQIDVETVHTYVELETEQALVATVATHIELENMLILVSSVASYIEYVYLRKFGPAMQSA